MQINSVTIHNFRSIIGEKFSLKNYSLLIGANNSGKSNLIDAIRVFYEQGEKFDTETDFPKIRITDDEVWVEIEYQLTPEEASSLKDDYVLEGNILIARKYFLDTEERKAGIYAYIPEGLSETLFYGVKQVQQGKIGKIIYIPAVSKIGDETKLTGPSPLRQILHDIFDNLVAESPAFERLNENFDAFVGDFRREKTRDEKSIKGLEDEINQEISDWGLGFSLEINPIEYNDIIKNFVDYKIIDNYIDEKVKISQQGHGFQRHLIYTLITISTRYQKGSTSKKAKDFSPDFTLILFEEPEAFLHPSQQDTLGISLQQIANNEGNQVIIATHSTNFVSQNMLAIPSLVHFHRDQNAYTVLGQITEDKLDEIFAENIEINEIVKGTKFEADADDYLDDMEALKYYLWLNPDRCGMFFAKHVLLVEGTTEKALLNYLVVTGKLKIPQFGVFISDVIGKFNFHRFMKILGELKISHSVMYDGDDSGDYKKIHQEIKALILKNKNEFTKAIGKIPNDIEEYLMIEKTQKHRKPQHVLLKTLQGIVNEEKINDLIKGNYILDKCNHFCYN